MRRWRTCTMPSSTTSTTRVFGSVAESGSSPLPHRESPPRARGRDRRRRQPCEVSLLPCCDRYLDDAELRPLYVDDTESEIGQVVDGISPKIDARPRLDEW